MGKNGNMTYITDQNELYTGDIRVQVYMSRMLLDNFNRRVYINALVLFSTCELWINFRCSTFYNYGYYYRYIWFG